jgi:hypothetical protein
MDEEDGRSGALAVQTGHADAPSGVPTLSPPSHSCHPERSEGSAVWDSRLTTNFRALSLRFLFVARVGEKAIWVPQVSWFWRPGMSFHTPTRPDPKQGEQ